MGNGRVRLLERPFVRRRFASRSRVYGLLLVATLLCAFGALSCGGASDASEGAEAPKPKPKNAVALAQAIVGAKVGVLVYVDRTRNHPVGAKVASLGAWRSIFEGTGIDPQRDFVRAYAAAPSVRSGEQTIVVAEHTLTPDQVKVAIDTLVQRSDPPGEWLADAKVPTARVTVRRQTRAVAIVEPSFLVILPEKHARDGARFIGTGGFADPEGPEAAVATAVDPARSLRAPNVPGVPESIRQGRATITLRADGGVDIASTADSSSPEQATADADEMTSAADRATSIKIVFVKVRLFGPILFRAEGSQVKSDVRLESSDIDKLFALLTAIMPSE